MAQPITPADLKHMLDTQATCACIDVREPGEYNSTHIPGTSLVPRRELEFRMRRLVPYQGTLVVVCDDDGRRARLAAATLERMGYSHVQVLDGGINRWTTVGYSTEWGVNVPSKDFGEKMEVVHHVPTIYPEELCPPATRRENDHSRFSYPEEHRRATIPGSRSAPGGELALRISELVPDPDAEVVVHCAERTRSIIGARLLQRMGFRKVYDLRNGTMGWGMAGLELEHGSQRLGCPIRPPPAWLPQRLLRRVSQRRTACAAHHSRPAGRSWPGLSVKTSISLMCGPCRNTPRDTSLASSGPQADRRYSVPRPGGGAQWARRVCL